VDNNNKIEAQFVAGVVRELKSINDRMGRMEKYLEKRLDKTDKDVESIKEWEGTVDAWKAVVQATIDPEKIDKQIHKNDLKVKGLIVSVAILTPLTIGLIIALVKSIP
jgi:hypothetical protein